MPLQPFDLVLLWKEAPLWNPILPDIINEDLTEPSVLMNEREKSLLLPGVGVF